jgi:ubiquinone/menaquinone biosynthesis C-methylase UbiE
MTYPSWFFEIVRCPETGSPLQFIDDNFIRPDGTKYPIIEGIPNLVFPKTMGKEDARWQKFYDRFAPLYDLNERLGARILAGTNLPEERKRITSLLSLKKGARILEVSPGPGVFQPYIRQSIGNNGEFVALDLSLGMLKQCRKRKDLDVILVQGNGSYLPFADESFDALFHFGGVNLFDNPERALNEFVRIIRKGGIVSWGDEGFSHSLPDSWKKRFVRKMNPGYNRPRLAKPSGLLNTKEFEVYGGYAYLVVANR